MNDMNGVAMSESFLLRGDGDQREPRCGTETTKGKQGNHLRQLAGLSFFPSIRKMPPNGGPMAGASFQSFSFPLSS